MVIMDLQQWALPPNQNGGPVRDDAVMEDGVSDSRRRPFPSFQMDGGSLHMPADPIPSTRQEQMSDAYRSLADVRCVPCAAVCCIAGMACTRGRVMPSD
ncbi:hypothetical protein HYQ46_000283 [Verticillium longisporum]|nr:hypothetical protein HYQ46_000283 [Verticillium longisporum]